MLSTLATNKTHGQEFLEISRATLRDDYLPQLIKVVTELSDDDIWWRPNEASNSVGNLILHLNGNIGQWIVSSIGGVEFSRNRDAEFSEHGPIPKTELISMLTRTIAAADSVLVSIGEQNLLVRHQIQKFDVTALHAIYHVIEHFGYHLGQIVYVYKLRKAA
jgi:uncharacterized damage-inducible protein DinB